MRTYFRNIFGLTVLSTALIAGTATAQVKAPEVYFYPAQGWNISQNGLQCSVSSQFNNGFIVRFDGGEKWISRLDVDFRQNAFESGKTYNVELSVPGVKSKKFKATSANAQALSIDLKKQKELFKALRTSAVMDLNIEGNDFRFYLTGFASSAKAFESCMAGTTAPKPDTMDAPVTQANAMPEPSTEQNFLVNEAIAMEEKTKQNAGTAVVEILPEDPKPVVQEIPFKETVKVGDVAVQERVQGQVATDPEVVAEALAPVTAEVETRDVEVPEVIGRKRLSEQLAAQIENDPSLIAVEEATPIQRKKLEMPPEMEELALVPPPKEEAPVQVKEERAPEPIDMIKTEETPPPMPKETVLKPVEEEQKMAAETILFEPPTVPEPEPVTKVIEEVEDAPQPDESKLASVTPAQEVEPAPVAPPAKEVVTYTTPPIKVNKEVMHGEADFTAPPREDIQELRKQILALEDTVGDLKSENRALNDELRTAVRDSEEERLSIASENWNLEQATMRFNEAERQIKRLGQQLQRERARHNQEKRELESMLFDPQVTNEAQLARLAELESEIDRAKRELDDQRARYEERIRALEAQAGTQ